MVQREMILGMGLLTAGAVMGLVVLRVLPGAAILLVIGAVFITSYIAYRRNLGLLVIGCVLTAVAAYAAARTYVPGLDGVYLLLLLGMAFLAVFLLHTFRVKEDTWGQRYWPLLPTISFLLIGGKVLVEQMGVQKYIQMWMGTALPVVIILMGIGVIYKAFVDMTGR